MGGIIGRVSGLALVLAGLATASGAQGWQPLPAGGRFEGTGVCATGGAERLCFVLRCSTGSPLEFVLEASPGWPLGAGGADVTFLVDDDDPVAYRFAAVRADAGQALALAVHPVQHDRLLDRLRRGGRLTIWIRPEGAHATGVGFPLTGSGRSINALLDGRCVTISAQDPPYPAADPVIAAHRPAGALPAEPPAPPEADAAAPPETEPVPSPATDTGADTAAPAPVPSDPPAAAASLVPVDLDDGDEAALALAREIVGPIIEAVRAIEGKAPTLRARLIDLAPGKSLLFTHLCGGAYFGPTGCSGVIFAIVGESALPVLGDGELFTSRRIALDPDAAVDGWPALVLDEGTIWDWTGTSYARR